MGYPFLGGGQNSTQWHAVDRSGIGARRPDRAGVRECRKPGGTVARVGVDVIVLNGGSSSGKSTLATCLQARLNGTWLTLGIDDLIRALSHGPRDTGAGGTLEITSDGSVVVGEAFRAAELAWYEGVTAMARTGIGVIVDDVFLGGGASQACLQAALQGLAVVWVGVRCDGAVAEAREAGRGDRTTGMARDQAERVHQGVRYDLVVETSDAPADDCAATIVTWVGDHRSA
jgi:chloramphenicol 3-O phosphotransferase